MRSLLLLPLLALVACPAPEEVGETGETGTPGGDGTATATAVGECKTGARGPSLDETGYTPEFSMTAVVDGDDVVLHMIDVYANCCPSPGATATYSGATIRVDFSDVTTDDSCDCMCVFDFDLRVADVPAGTWTLDVYDGGESRGTLEVTVPG